MNPAELFQDIKLIKDKSGDIMVYDETECMVAVAPNISNLNNASRPRFNPTTCTVRVN